MNKKGVAAAENQGKNQERSREHMSKYMDLRNTLQVESKSLCDLLRVWDKGRRKEWTLSKGLALPTG